jgi:hypothetical protein
LISWLGIILKRRLESEKAVEDAKKERERRQGGFFSKWFSGKNESLEEEK